MSTTYRWVQWNRHKKIYDAVLAACIAVSIAAFVGIGFVLHPPPSDVSPPILLMRALGLTGFLLLHLILAIGPLARLDDRVAPLLYNRRHLGVAMFVVLLLHAVVAIGFYGGFGRGVWLANVVAGSYRPGAGVPFELLGFLSLIIFAVMAATSHDFWLAFLGPRGWKRLHMLVYPAYGLAAAHVLLGAAMERVSPVLGVLTLLGGAAIMLVHLAAGLRQARVDAASRRTTVADGWVDALAAEEIRPDRAAIVTLPGGDSVAVFRHNDRFSAISNVCTHQGGPLGEGQIVDGCVTCPWHGYQYRAEDGCSPPPYTERLPTYDLRVEGDRIHIRAEANTPGSPAAGGTSA
ncbi:MAG: Rieske 2Fe-2S domain-containing protein [Planctomycetota bacterium]